MGQAIAHGYERFDTFKTAQIQMDENSPSTSANHGESCSTPLADSCNQATGAKGPHDSESCLFLLAVFGKSGTGKSSLCNQIAGREDLFPVGHGLSSVTTRCQVESVQQDGRFFKVMDTPGEGDMMEITQTVKNEGVKVHGKVSIVFCVRCDSRYAVEEHSIYLELKNAWRNDEDFGKRLVVAFTHGEQLSDDSDGEESPASETTTDRELTDIEQNNSVEETEKAITAKERKLHQMLSVTWPQLKALTENAQGRFVIFSNKKIRQKDASGFKLIRLLEKMDLTVEQLKQCDNKQTARSWLCYIRSLITNAVHAAISSFTTAVVDAAIRWAISHPMEACFLIAAAVVILNVFPFSTMWDYWQSFLSA